MTLIKAVVSFAFFGHALSQTYTLTGCHRHGDVEYCYLPNGEETPFTTYAPAAAASATPTNEVVATSIASGESAATASAPASVTGCHPHGTTLFCIANGEEYEVISGVTDAATAPKSFDGCHAHEEKLHCESADGAEVELAPMASETGHEDHEHSEGESRSQGSEAESTSGLPSGAVECHFHAGVEHCVDANGNTVESGCRAPARDYNIPLRIGLLFVILVTSAIGVYPPIVMSRLLNVKFDGIVFVALRQFGCGIIISTALVHLLTHAQLYFSSECLSGLHYEATAAALVMAGLFLTFLVEFFVHKFFPGHGHHHGPASPAKAADQVDAAERGSDASSQEIDVTTGSASVMEAGIVFHSILIGITLVVAGDSGFITLFVVILFHQMFEGIALGTRLAMMPAGLLKKVLMAALFAIITPIGMAIGIGVLSRFNGNDPSTIIAIATLNGLSAGILLWIGLVEMWADEWWRGPLAGAELAKTTVGLFSLMLGMALMSLLGKWA